MNGIRLLRLRCQKVIGGTSAKFSAVDICTSGEVLTVLGGDHGNFSDTYQHKQNGQSYPIYNFPKREAEVRRASFLAKVPEVLKGGEQKFLSSYKSAQNKTLPTYNFPKRETMLMAMSYSYELQAQIFDA